jgi:hypothetical protein
VTVTLGGVEYAIRVENPDHVCRGVTRVELDGVRAGAGIPLGSGARRHTVRVVLGAEGSERLDDREEADRNRQPA